MVDSPSTETDERLTAAVGQYALSEVTVGQAADRADCSRFELYETLRRSSVTLRMTADESTARDDLDVLRAVR
jgi:predicted HTH domain antitoxin